MRTKPSTTRHGNETTPWRHGEHGANILSLHLNTSWTISLFQIHSVVIVQAKTRRSTRFRWPGYTGSIWIDAPASAHGRWEQTPALPRVVPTSPSTVGLLFWSVVLCAFRSSSGVGCSLGCGGQDMFQTAHETQKVGIHTSKPLSLRPPPPSPSGSLASARARSWVGSCPPGGRATAYSQSPFPRCCRNIWRIQVILALPATATMIYRYHAV